jgi:hypothetical protein
MGFDPWSHTSNRESRTWISLIRASPSPECGYQPVVFIEALLRRHAENIIEFERNITAACLEIF